MSLARIIWMGTMLLVAVACYPNRDAVSQEDGESVHAALGFSLSTASVPSTKADTQIITELLSSTQNPHFRGLSGVRILPFYTGLGNLVQANSQANGYVIPLADIDGGLSDTEAYFNGHYHSGLLATSHAHLYSGSEVALPTGTTAVLAYGRAALHHASSEIEEKHLNGSLLEEGWDWQSDYHQARDIFFCPEPIYSQEAASAAQAIAEVISNVALACYEKVFEYQIGDHNNEATLRLNLCDSDLGDEVLAALFSYLTNDGKPFSSATKTLLGILRTAKKTLEDSDSINLESDYTDYYVYTIGENSYTALDPDNEYKPITMGQLYVQLRANVLSAIEDGISSLDDGSHFPRDYGLPCGAVIVKWKDGVGFVPIPSGLEGYLPLTHFCYMPPLYYYVNTLVKTSYDRYIYELYGSKTWEEILPYYSVGGIVTHDVKAIALEDPLQYACAMMVATVKASAAILKDKNGNDVSIDNEVFPLTGVIIGGQYKQHFDFTPVTDDGDNELQEEHYLFDNHFSNLYLSTSGTDPFRTLVLPTPKDRDVYFLLEFENESGNSFVGADGVIAPDSHFYLAGKLEPPTDENRAEGLDRAFMSDHYTTVSCTISSLKDAFLAVPQLGDPSLDLGVQTQLTWYFSSSSHVVLD